MLERFGRRMRRAVGEGRRDFERELDDEMRFHIEMQTAKNVQRGMAPADARRAAEREFGRVDRYKEEVRDARGITVLDDLGRDVHFAIRGLRRSPGFVLIAVLCLALGIGANAAIFSVINVVLLRPFPYAEPQRLVRLYESLSDQPGWTGSVSWANYLDWVEGSSRFQGLAAWNVGSANLQGAGEPERLRSLSATGNLFEVLGARSLLGRTFREDDVGAAEPVVVLGEGFWHRRFGGDPSIIGSTLTFDGREYSVIGVVPRSFTFPAGSSEREVYLPMGPPANAENLRGSRGLAVVGRLAPGATQESALEEMRAIAAGLRERFPNVMANRTVVGMQLRETVTGAVRKPLLVLLGAVGFVLLIACANVANLLLARAATRRQEVAIRLALGASRLRLVRQFLVESVLLALAGAALGALFAWWSLGALRPMVERALPRVGQIALDLPVFGYLLAIAVASALIFGIFPALQLSRGNVRDALAGASGKASGDRGQRRFRGAMVVVEIALSLVLLVGAGLMLRGFNALRGTDPGIAQVENLLTARLTIDRTRYPGGAANERLIAPILENTRRLPGVRSAAAINMLPIQEAWTNAGFNIVGREPAEPGREPMTELRVVTPGWFETIGVPILVGRGFSEEDGTRGDNPIIINEAFARRHFPDESPIGRQISGFMPATLTIIGVAGNVRQVGLDRPPQVELYFTYRDPAMMGWIGSMVIVARTDVPPQSLTRRLRDAVLAVDRDQPIWEVQSMAQVIDTSLSSRRLNLSLFTIFALIALLLSAAGLFGVISYLVTQRTREIGIRVALGAGGGTVVRLVMRQGIVLAVLGLVVGITGAFVLSRFLEGMLYEVSARDPLTFAIVTAVLLLVAMFATWLPARRASRVDPLVAIRSE